ncbi:hypothetical protein D3C80_858210 [compost metagenome]
MFQLGQLFRPDGEQHLGQDLLQHGILLAHRHGDGHPQLVAGEDHLIAIAEALLQRLLQGGHAHQHIVHLAAVEQREQSRIAAGHHRDGPDLGQQSRLDRTIDHAHLVPPQIRRAGQLRHPLPGRDHPVYEGVIRGEQQGLTAILGRGHRRDEVQLARLEQGLGLGPALGRHQGKLETGARTQQFQQVGDEAVQLAAAVDLAHRRPVGGHAIAQGGVLRQPVQLALVEDDLAWTMGQLIVDYAPRLQNAAPFIDRNVVERRLQQALQRLVLGADRDGQRGVLHPIRGRHRQVRLLLQPLQPYQGWQIPQIGIRQPLLDHEDRLIAAVGLDHVVDAQQGQLFAGAEAELAHPAQLPRLLQGGLLFRLGQQDGPRQHHEIRGKQHLLQPGLARSHPDQHVDLVIHQGLLGTGIVGIGLVAQGQVQLVRQQGGKIVKRAAEATPAIGIDIGGPGHGRHADHQFVVRREPQPFRQPQSVLIQMRIGGGPQAPAGQPAQQNGTNATIQHG